MENKEKSLMIINDYLSNKSIRDICKDNQTYQERIYYLLKKYKIKHRKGFKDINKGNKNGQWLGDKIGYNGVHKWAKQNKPKPTFCENCNKNQPYDLANISGEYKRDINDFKWLCRRCHMIEDGRLNNLLKSRPLNNLRGKDGRYIKVTN